jgi:two-component system sensor histidine kinase UhpB
MVFDEDEAASRMIGAAHDITSKKLLESKLVREGVTKQREISNAVLKALQREREDIGKELHDNLNQIPVATKLYI